MNTLSSIILPAFLGLVAGVGHGIISHHNDLPFSLTDQLLQPMSISHNIIID